MSDFPSKADLAAGAEARAKSFRLVGQFLHLFALVEKQLDSVMGAALGLEDLQTIILGPNIPLMTKIHITQAAIEVSPLNAKKKNHYNRHLNDLKDLSTDRNTMAHNPFSPTDDLKRTKFVIVRAKGRLNVAEDVWTDQKFKQQFEKLMNMCEKFADLETELKGVLSGRPRGERLAKLFREMLTNQDT